MTYYLQKLFLIHIDRWLETAAILPGLGLTLHFSEIINKTLIIIESFYF